ncbi:MAG: HAD-IG family 5'-nucleotidase [Bdellovibrionales bacterium]
MTDVFCNRTLNFKKIKYLGFDMDHTLVRYNTDEFESLVQKITVDKLLKLKNYPEDIKNIPFENDRIIRGLIVDQKNGNILKLNLHGSIKQSYHGTKPIDFKKQKRFYKGTLIDLNDPNYLSVDTAFSIAYGILFAHMVDMKDGDYHEQMPSYQEISADILECVDIAHRDDSLKGQVVKELDKHVILDPEMVERLEKFIKHGKKLFVVTNSDYAYTKIMLDYSINPYLKEHKHWSEIFEFVITLAMKPRFFYDKLQFLKIDPDTGLMSNHDGPMEPGIYQGGCADRFTEDLKLSGDDILYVGDHIYGDIVRLKKDCNWRTALVVEELAEEVKNIQKSKPVFDDIWELMDQKQPLEKELQKMEDDRRELGHKADPKLVDKLLEQIHSIDKDIGEKISKHQSVFNKNWGEVMRAGNDESYFASQVQRYACIYTSTLADILRVSPRNYFRASRREQAHEFTAKKAWNDQ